VFAFRRQAIRYRPVKSGKNAGEIMIYLGCGTIANPFRVTQTQNRAAMISGSVTLSARNRSSVGSGFRGGWRLGCVNGRRWHVAGYRGSGRWLRRVGRRRLGVGFCKAFVGSAWISACIAYIFPILDNFIVLTHRFPGAAILACVLL